ncbi:MAG: transposase [Gammaproteobacteria bacterium]|nr:transposase [Gammaproteobacteria bacterium]MBU0788277.1 transposase [Gammaproteobacteria bacterium]MBU0815226.1 transposase [Gammaproteobacteria bacterium]MBU1785666.1 transposase [Gammaproteobacteria bacterium]
MTRTRRSFTDEFKREAVKLVKQPGAMVTHIARDLGIEASVLRRWVNQEREGVLDMRPNRPIRSEAATEVERLNVNCGAS